MPFSPNDAPGTLILWLSGDDETFQDDGFTTPAGVDDPLGGWRDQGGLGNDAAEATAGQKPVLKLLTNAGHSFRGALFDNSDDVLVIAPDAALELAGDFHLYALCRPNGGSSGCVLMHGANLTTGNSYECRLTIGTSFRLEYVHGDGATFETLVSADGPALNEFHVLEWRLEGSTITFYCDGVSLGTATLALVVTPAAGASAYVGNRQGEGLPFPGEIAQVLLYDAAHDDAWRGRLESYLAGVGGTGTEAGGTSRYGVFGPRTRRNRIKRHFFALARRWPTWAVDSFTSSNADRPGDSDSGHNWVTFSGDDLSHPFRLVNNRMRPALAVLDAAWGGLPMGVADVHVRVRATLAQAAGEGVGLAFRLDGDGNGWLFHYHTDGHWYLSQIAVATPGTPPTITHWDDLGADPVWLPGETRLLEVRARGRTVTCHVSAPSSRALPQLGTTQTLAADGTGATIHGCFAMGPAANEFDNVKIWPKTRG